MRFAELLGRCQGQKVVVNNAVERTVVSVDEDFLVLQGGNRQLRVFEFVPLAHIVRLTRLEYQAGHVTFSIDVTATGADESYRQGE